MFYQTSETPSDTPSDTDALRFLWWPGSIEDRPEDYKMLVHIFCAKSCPCCANKALNKTAQDNEIRKSPTVMFVSSASQIDILLQRYIYIHLGHA